MGKGTDYGMGQTNIDHETGIRYGVIPMYDVTWWVEEAEPDFGEATCPKCGESWAMEGQAGDEWYCAQCNYTFDNDKAWPDEPLGWVYETDEYSAYQAGNDTDIFVIKSPYYTRASYCSLCAPGACHLKYPNGEGEKTYCFGHDWFEGDAAPYPVYRVTDNTLVKHDV